MLIRHLWAGAVFALAPLQPGAWDTRSYVPPGEPGYIYTVIQRAEAAPAGPMAIRVRWGAWQHTGYVDGEPGARPPDGVVLRLRHARWDRYRLTVGTTGRIVSGPVQGPPPPQWDQPGYERVIW